MKKEEKLLETQAAIEKAKISMDLAIWALGNKKATITKAISFLVKTGLDDKPEIKAAIKLLEKEREILKKKTILD